MNDNTDWPTLVEVQQAQEAVHLQQVCLSVCLYCVLSTVYMFTNLVCGYTVYIFNDCACVCVYTTYICVCVCAMFAGTIYVVHYIVLPTVSEQVCKM